METEPGSVRTYIRFKYGDVEGEVLYEYFYSGLQDNISTQHINIIVADA
jgi:hypothetical protein